MGEHGGALFVPTQTINKVPVFYMKHGDNKF